MKITKLKLNQIIKEEIQNILNEKYFVNQWPFSTTATRVDHWGGSTAREDEAAGMAHARGYDTHLNPSIDVDRDRIDRERSFGPEEVEDKARELAARAGTEDNMTYDWRDFMENAKSELMRTGL